MSLFCSNKPHPSLPTVMRLWVTVSTLAIMSHRPSPLPSMSPSALALFMSLLCIYQTYSLQTTSGALAEAFKNPKTKLITLDSFKSIIAGSNGYRMFHDLVALSGQPSLDPYNTLPPAPLQTMDQSILDHLHNWELYLDKLLTQGQWLLDQYFIESLHTSAKPEMCTKFRMIWNPIAQILTNHCLLNITLVTCRLLLSWLQEESMVIRRCCQCRFARWLTAPVQWRPLSLTCRPFEKALERVSNVTCAKATVTLLVIITIMVLLTVSPIVHPHHNVDPTSRRSGKLTWSTVPVTLPMGSTMPPESSLCPLTILMMPIVLPRMLLLFQILFKPNTRTTWFFWWRAYTCERGIIPRWLQMCFTAAFHFWFGKFVTNLGCPSQDFWCDKIGRGVSATYDLPFGLLFRGQASAIPGKDTDDNYGLDFDDFDDDLISSEQGWPLHLSPLGLPWLSWEPSESELLTACIAEVDLTSTTNVAWLLWYTTWRAYATPCPQGHRQSSALSYISRVPLDPHSWWHWANGEQLVILPLRWRLWSSPLMLLVMNFSAVVIPVSPTSMVSAAVWLFITVIMHLEMLASCCCWFKDYFIPSLCFCRWQTLREPAPCQLRCGITDIFSQWPSQLPRVSILLSLMRQLLMFAKCPINTGIAMPIITNVSPADVARCGCRWPLHRWPRWYVPIGEYSWMSWWHGMSVCSSYIFCWWAAFISSSRSRFGLASARCSGAMWLCWLWLTILEWIPVMVDTVPFIIWLV